MVHNSNNVIQKGENLTQIFQSLSNKFLRTELLLLLLR